MEGALRVSIDCYDTARSRQLELEVGVVWHRIESSECGSSEQCVIATTEWDDNEDQFFASKLSRDLKTTSSVIEPVQHASTPGMTPLKVVLVGLFLEGSIPILRTVS